MEHQNKIDFQSTVSTELLEFQPYGAPVSFTISVTNRSGQLAQFEAQLFPESVPEAEADHSWYDKFPVTSSKIPPGGRVEFTITLKDNPLPDATSIRFFAKISSPQLSGFQRHRLRLVILPKFSLEPRLIPAHSAYYPAQDLKLSLQLTNPFTYEINIRLKITDFPLHLVEYLKQTIDLKLEAKTTKLTTFYGKLKKCSHTSAGKYNFTIQAYIQERLSGSVEGTLEVLPFGNLKLIQFHDQLFPPQNTSLQFWIPPQKSWLPQKVPQPFVYGLIIQNTSNLNPAIPQEIQINVSGKDANKFTTNLTDDARRNLSPDQTIKAKLQLHTKRPWWGRIRQFQLSLATSATNLPSGYSYQGDLKPLDIYLRPFLPFWMQIVSGILAGGVLLLLLFSIFAQPHHTASVKTVTFRRGSSNPEVYSGSADKTVRKWQVNLNNPLCKFLNWQRYCLKSKGVLKKIDQSVILLKFRSENNDVLAIVPESDQVLYWDFDLGKQIDVTHEGSPQILDLLFTKNSQELFTSDGQKICRWKQKTNDYIFEECVLEKTEEFPIFSLALSQDGNKLIFGGNEHKLYIWEWKKTSPNSQSKNYYLVQDTCPQNKIRCTRNDNIKSIDTAQDIFATADDEGYISLYNLASCFTLDDQSMNCQKIDEWQILSDSESPEPVAIDTISLTKDGRYLIAATKDGKIRLWALNSQGRSQTINDFEEDNKGTILASYSTDINSIDLIYGGNEQELMVVSAGEDHQVRLIRYNLEKHSRIKN
jgi:WD40 repeat protein